MIRGSGFFFLKLGFAFVMQICVASPSFAIDSSSCRDRFADLALERVGKKQYSVNNMRITGAADYSLATVREALGLSESAMDRLPASSKILSVGEGISPLVPFLRKRFSKTRGLDLWYDQKDLPEELAGYVARNRSALVSGSALQIPFPDKSQDLVLSNFLINNFYEEANRQQAVEEMIRVLAVGGEARITSFRTSEYPFVALLKKKYGSEITIDIEPFFIVVADPDGPVGTKMNREGRRIVIHRNLGGWD